MHRTVLPGVHAELVDAGRRLCQHVDGAAGGVHVVEEVDGQGGEGEHQHPQHGQHVGRHDELCVCVRVKHGDSSEKSSTGASIRLATFIRPVSFTDDLTLTRTHTPTQTSYHSASLSWHVPKDFFFSQQL